MYDATQRDAGGEEDGVEGGAAPRMECSRIFQLLDIELSAHDDALTLVVAWITAGRTRGRCHGTGGRTRNYSACRIYPRLTEPDATAPPRASQ